MTGVAAYPVTGLPEITEGVDLAALIGMRIDLVPGDVVVVTSKVVSKAEGRVITAADREGAIRAETVRVVARRGLTIIARTRHGLTLAAAGVDASNTPGGTVALLPVDPDASARRLRAALADRAGGPVAVVVSDTAGRPWREGQTDIAVGVAGLRPLLDLAGRLDDFGNELQVTAPAIADEVAGLADLVKGKLAGVPVAVVRGLDEHVLAAGDHGPGAAALLRPAAGDMFGLGSKEAILAAVSRDDPQALAALRRDPVDVHDLVALATALSAGNDVPVLLHVREHDDGAVEVVGASDLATSAALERVVIAATTSQWRVIGDGRNDGRCRIVLRSEVAGR